MNCSLTYGTMTVYHPPHWKDSVGVAVCFYWLVGWLVGRVCVTRIFVWLSFETKALTEVSNEEG